MKLIRFLAHRFDIQNVNEVIYMPRMETQGKDPVKETEQRENCES